jgi:hypothetical protein
VVSLADAFEKSKARWLAFLRIMRNRPWHVQSEADQGMIFGIFTQPDSQLAHEIVERAARCCAILLPALTTEGHKSKEQRHDRNERSRGL